MPRGLTRGVITNIHKLGLPFLLMATVKGTPIALLLVNWGVSEKCQDMNKVPATKLGLVWFAVYTRIFGNCPSRSSVTSLHPCAHYLLIALWAYGLRHSPPNLGESVKALKVNSICTIEKKCISTTLNHLPLHPLQHLNTASVYRNQVRL